MSFANPLKLLIESLSMPLALKHNILSFSHNFHSLSINSKAQISGTQKNDDDFIKIFFHTFYLSSKEKERERDIFK
jgi:hypothetical protein